MGMSAKEDDWETGFGAGVGFVPMNNFMLEAIFEDFEGTNVISAGIRYSF
jgi:hypothetical protein